MLRLSEDGGELVHDAALDAHEIVLGPLGQDRQVAGVWRAFADGERASHGHLQGG